jgi:hypothetical protein
MAPGKILVHTSELIHVTIEHSCSGLWIPRTDPCVCTIDIGSGAIMIEIDAELISINGSVDPMIKLLAKSITGKKLDHFRVACIEMYAVSAT